MGTRPKTNSKTNTKANSEAKKSKGFFMKFLIAALITSVFIFTAATLYVFLQTSSEPSTLIVSFFGFATGELGLTALIKKL